MVRTIEALLHGNRSFFKSLRHQLQIIVMFTTDRLRLRAYTTADLATVLLIANDHLVQRTLISEHIVPRSQRFAAAKLKGITNEALLYVVLDAADRHGEVINAALLAVASVKNHDVSLEIGLLPDVWNKGHGSEATRFLVDYAFRDLGVHRVSLGVLENNKGAIEMYKKM